MRLDPPQVRGLWLAGTISRTRPQHRRVESEGVRLSGTGSTVWVSLCISCEKAVPEGPMLWLPHGPTSCTLLHVVESAPRSRSPAALPGMVREGQELGQTKTVLHPSGLCLCSEVSVKEHPRPPVYFRNYNLPTVILIKDFSQKNQPLWLITSPDKVDSILFGKVQLSNSIATSSF